MAPFAKALLVSLFFLAVPVSPMPLEPVYEKHLTGIPIEGSYAPIGPGTDEGLYNGLLEGDILVDPLDGRNAVSSPTKLWPSGVVVYKVDDDVGCPDSPQCEILMKAMDHYHVRSCIRFKEWSGEKNYVRVFFNANESGACWSPVGRAGNGEQKLSLGHRCWYLGIVVHELAHSIGFWHEMNRPDRDDWIYIFWSNILPNYASAFNKQEVDTVDTLGENFDYESIMMYDEYAFSKDGRSPTVQSKMGNEIGPIWKKPGLSDSDLRRLLRLYQCEGRKPKEGFPYNITCNFNQHTCGFKNGGSAVWNWRTVNDTDGYVYSSYENSGTTPGFLMSINYHRINPEVGTSLGCVRFWYLIQEDTIAYLKLNQAFLERVTQLENDPETTFELWYNDTSEGQWVHVAIPLYVTEPFKLIFEAEFSEDNVDGTIALDDVEVLYKECSVEGISSMVEAETTDSEEISDRPIVAIPPPSVARFLRRSKKRNFQDSSKGTSPSRLEK